MKDSYALNADLSEKAQKSAFLLYIFLAAVFVGSLITCNLIANKFIEIDLGFKTVVISAGVLPYPITFLITDVLSEVYGRKRTNHVVIAGFIVSLFVLFILWLGHIFPAIDGSPVTDDAYNQVFKNSDRVILSSMTAYLTAQLVDVRLFHFWKRLTKGKHLWLRNNASTLVSQIVDTTLVVGIIFYDRESVGTIVGYIGDGWMFKASAALIDTAFIYLIMYGIRRVFKLKVGQEIHL
ncbi:queuosine precursor transporter [Phaeocystidibacter luteus]|uniref:Probable queuosine precursor transporter n=1 Tax=Phaeocystidibacter luteus TaxID=911197 RepID=A0A6N6RCN5_9FLAO|nr:queuosine precursor transporter [Phaeocystidibacter luteus]KAB2805328.1 queuosine precursor transporter [Phaeocystidibacter luteus]